jgi:hypothetical protein
MDKKYLLLKAWDVLSMLYFGNIIPLVRKILRGMIWNIVQCPPSPTKKKY